MKQFIATFLTVTLAASGFAAETRTFATNSLAFPEHGTLQIKSPAGWRFVQKEAPGFETSSRTAELSQEKGEIAVQITVFWDGTNSAAPGPTAEKLVEIVNQVGEIQYAPGSVEKKVVMEKFKDAHVLGCFARFTDSRWVDKPPPPGEYRHVAAGAVRCGDLWGVFTLLTNDKDGPQFKQAMAVIESLEKGNRK